MSRLFGLLVALVSVAYPFAVYFGAGHLSPSLFAALLGGLWLARLLSNPSDRNSRRMTGAVLVFCLLLVLADEPALLRWYPVLVSLLLGLLFASSLKIGMPMAERLARLREPELPPVAVRYTRRVTEVWAVFMLANGLLVVALNLWAPLSWWALYTGLISYLLMGLLFAGEWLVRQRVRRTA